MYRKYTHLIRTFAVILLLVILTGCFVDSKSVPKKVFIPNVEMAPASQAKSAPGMAYPVPVASPSAVLASPTNPSKGNTPVPTKPTPSPAYTGDPPMPTPFWPTLRPGTTATSYARPAGAKGETLPPERWKEWPILPVVSDRAKQIYRAGIAAGRDPHKFSKVGDCQVIRQYFLGIFDDPAEYSLSEKYKYLEHTITQFQGSYDRVSEAVRTGFNVASVLTPFYANPKNCKSGETPLMCEYRIWNPSIAIISMETWTEGRPTAAYENYLRQIVEYLLSNNILPVVSTKADNLEGDHSINLAVARVAAAYDIPLWNFWRVADPLPSNGLLEDRFHLTNAPNRYDWPSTFEKAWPMRNLTALQVIDKVWLEVRK